MVRAPRWVEIVSTTVYLSGESSCVTVIVPSPQEANASCVTDRNCWHPRLHRWARCLRFSVVTRHQHHLVVAPMKSRLWARSIVHPVGSSQFGRGNLLSTFNSFRIEFDELRLVFDVDPGVSHASVCAASGLPVSGTVPALPPSWHRSPRHHGCAR